MVEVIVIVVAQVVVTQLVKIAYFVTVRVGVGAMVVTTGAVLLPEITTTGDGVMVSVTWVVEFMVIVIVGAVEVEVI